MSHNTRKTSLVPPRSRVAAMFVASRLPISSPNLPTWTSCDNFQVMLCLQHLDVSNLRGRRESERERYEAQRVELDVEFKFGMAEEAKD